MTDEELIARLDNWIDQEIFVLVASDVQPIRDRIEALNKRERQLWDLLEEIDAQIDLAEEISEEFAEKVRVALWESDK